jgi:hypothetical protein
VLFNAHHLSKEAAMSNSDTKLDSVQVSFARERIACLKKVVGKKFLQREVLSHGLDKRLSLKCPAYMMVWFTIAMWLYGNDSYPQVVRWLQRFSKKFMPTSSALTQARAKIGVPIMARVYRIVVQCLCSVDTSNSYYAGRKLVAVDGFVLNLPDSEGNRRAFGRPKNGTSVGAYPQARIVKSVLTFFSHFLPNQFAAAKPPWQSMFTVIYL